MSSEKSRPVHIIQLDHWDKPDQPTLCGHMDPKRVADYRLHLYPAARSVNREDLSEACGEEFQKGKREAENSFWQVDLYAHVKGSCDREPST